MATSPVGQRFSQIYLERGAPTRDSDRFRNRLAEGFLGNSAGYPVNTSHRLAQLMAQELGIQVPSDQNGYRPEEVFRRGQLRDVLDSITLFYRLRISQGVDHKATHWRQFVARAMAEENIGYRVDDECVVQFHVDQEFEHNRVATIATLQHPNLAAALAAHEDAYRHLDSRPPDTKASVRSIFEATEIIARLIRPEAQNLNGWLAKNTLKQSCLAVMPNDPTEQAVVGFAFDGLADWITGLHHYRHGQAVNEPAAPSEALAVYALSSGSAYVRMLADCYLRINGADAP